MIEKILYDYLVMVTGLPVSFENIENEERWIKIEKTGSRYKDSVATATFAIQSYAPSLYDAASMNHMLKQFVRGMVTDARISAVEINGDYNYTDTSRKGYRYQMVVDVIYCD